MPTYTNGSHLCSLLWGVMLEMTGRFSRGSSAKGGKLGKAYGVSICTGWNGQWKYDGDLAKQELSLLMSLIDHLGILTLVVRRLDMGQALSRLDVIWAYKHCVLLSLRMLEHLCTTRTIMFEHVYWRLQSVSKLPSKVRSRKGF